MIYNTVRAVRGETGPAVGGCEVFDQLGHIPDCIATKGFLTDGEFGYKLAVAPIVPSVVTLTVAVANNSPARSRSIAVHCEWKAGKVSGLRQRTSCRAVQARSASALSCSLRSFLSTQSASPTLFVSF